MSRIDEANSKIAANKRLAQGMVNKMADDSDNGTQNLLN